MGTIWILVSHKTTMKVLEEHQNRGVQYEEHKITCRSVRENGETQIGVYIYPGLVSYF